MPVARARQDLVVLFLVAIRLQALATLVLRHLMTALLFKLPIDYCFKILEKLEKVITARLAVKKKLRILAPRGRTPKTRRRSL